MERKLLSSEADYEIFLKFRVADGVKIIHEFMDKPEKYPCIILYKVMDSESIRTPYWLDYEYIYLSDFEFKGDDISNESRLSLVLGT